MCAEGPQRQLAMIARMNRLVHLGHAFGLQAGKQQTRLHLGAGDWRLIIQAAQRTAVDGHRSMTVRELDPRAHRREWRANALHGPAGEGSVPDQSAGERLGREQAGQHAHG